MFNTNGVNFQQLTVSAYVGFCFCLCANENRPINDWFKKSANITNRDSLAQLFSRASCQLQVSYLSVLIGSLSCSAMSFAIGQSD